MNTLIGGVSAWDSAGSTPTVAQSSYGPSVAATSYTNPLSSSVLYYSAPVAASHYIEPIQTATSFSYAPASPVYSAGASWSAPAVQTPTYSTGSTWDSTKIADTPTYSAAAQYTQPVAAPVSNNNVNYAPVQNNTSYAYSNNPMNFAALPGLPGSETPAAPIQSKAVAQAAVIPQQNNYLNIGGNGQTNIGSNALSGTAQASQSSQPITWGQNVGGTFYDTSGQLQGAFTLAQIQQMGGQTSDASGVHSIAQTAQAYAAQAAAQQPQVQQQVSGRLLSPSAASGTNQYSTALSTLARLQNDIATGKDSLSGQTLDYASRQEKQAQIQQLYTQTMAWNPNDQMQLAQVMDEKAKAEARAYLANPTLYHGVVNDNEYQKMNLQATYGLGAQAVASAGGQVGWGAGDQQYNELMKAKALGVSVPDTLLMKAAFEAQHWDQSMAIYKPEAGTAADPMSWNTGLAYNTMGIGANNTQSAVYGADPVWDPGAWGNYYEPGGGYDQTYGPKGGYYNYLHQQEATNGGFASYGSLKPQDAIVQGYGTSITPGLNSPGTGGNYMGPGNANGYGFPTGADSNNTPFKDDWIPGAPMGDSTYYPPGTTPPTQPANVPEGQPMIGDQARLDGFDNYTQSYLDKLKAARAAGGPDAPTLSDINKIADNFAKQRAMLESGKYSPSEAYGPQASTNIPTYDSKYINNDQSEKAYTGGQLEAPLGKPTGAPGTLSVSNPNTDVFSDPIVAQPQRIDNSGLLDGMLQGQIAGAPTTVPSDGWAYQLNQNVADQMAAKKKQAARPVSNLLSSILSAYYGK